MNQPLTLAAVLLACATLLACGGDGGGDRAADNGGSGGLSIGAAHTLEVRLSGYGLVTDAENGLVFEFPNGGNGTLTVTPVLDGPERPFPGGEGYQIEYTGTDSLALRITFARADEVVYVLGFGTLFGSVDDGRSPDNRWVPMPSTGNADGSRSYELALPGTGASAARRELSRSDHRGYSQYWISRITNTSSDAERASNIRLQVLDNINHWLNLMPEPMKTNARSAVDGPMDFRMFRDGLYYTGFTRRRLGNATTPMLGLPLTATADNIAHEVGHYMTHVVVGDAAYLVLEDGAPDENHGLGVQQNRATVVEEYAYFSQYLLTGSVGIADPTEPRQLFAGMSPAKTDFPGLEGFGAALLASLNRTQTMIVGQVSRQQEDVPVVGASFGDIIGIIAGGAADMRALRNRIESYLTTAGKLQALPALAERLGWSYHGSGYLMDTGGLPVAGAEVENISTFGGKEYVSSRGTTAADGGFALGRVFPGPSQLRFRKDARTSVKDLNVDWERLTTEDLALGSHTLDQGSLEAECTARVTVLMNDGSGTFSPWTETAGPITLRLTGRSGAGYTWDDPATTTCCDVVVNADNSIYQATVTKAAGVGIRLSGLPHVSAGRYAADGDICGYFALIHPSAEYRYFCNVPPAAVELVCSRSLRPND